MSLLHDGEAGVRTRTGTEKIHGGNWREHTRAEHAENRNKHWHAFSKYRHMDILHSRYWHLITYINYLIILLTYSVNSSPCSLILNRSLKLLVSLE